MNLLRGLPGHPLHPPLTDATIGIYTAATIFGVLSVLGVSEENTAHAWWLALVVGLVVTVPTALTGLAEWLTIRRGTELWKTATAHLAAMVSATVLFLLAEPDQYIYNPAFHLKVLFMALAGINASMFYLTSYRRATAAGAPPDAPALAKVIAAASIVLWLSVIVAGRLLTFYRPFPCGPEGPGFLAECIPEYYR